MGITYWEEELETFLLNSLSAQFDHCRDDLIEVDKTAISTPLDSIPLYIKHPEKVSIILLKSSQAVCSSVEFSLGTPALQIQLHI